MENTVRSFGATPATIAVIEGRVHVGLQPAELQALASGSEGVWSRSACVILHPPLAEWQAAGQPLPGRCTLPTGLASAFATGGIGGADHQLGPHARGAADISADLPALATPMVVVCAGAKAILDLQATLEYLETWSVPVVGYKTNYFPAFYTASSGLSLHPLPIPPRRWLLLRGRTGIWACLERCWSVFLRLRKSPWTPKM